MLSHECAVFLQEVGISWQEHTELPLQRWILNDERNTLFCSERYKYSVEHFNTLILQGVRKHERL